MSSTYYPAARSRFSFEQALLALFIGLVLFGISLAAAIIGSRILYAGRIFPGVTVSGIDVGGLRPQDAARRISQDVGYPTNGKILLRDGDRIWSASPMQLGLSLDPHRAA